MLVFCKVSLSLYIRFQEKKELVCSNNITIIEVVFSVTPVLTISNAQMQKRIEKGNHHKDLLMVSVIISRCLWFGLILLLVDRIAEAHHLHFKIIVALHIYNRGCSCMTRLLLSDQSQFARRS